MLYDLFIFAATIGSIFLVKESPSPLTVFLCIIFIIAAVGRIIEEERL